MPEALCSPRSLRCSCLTEDSAACAQAEETSEAYKGLTEFLQKTLGERVEKVAVSRRLADSPCALVTSKFGWSAYQERIMKSQVCSASGLTPLLYQSLQQPDGACPHRASCDLSDARTLPGAPIRIASGLAGSASQAYSATKKGAIWALTWHLSRLIQCQLDVEVETMPGNMWRLTTLLSRFWVLHDDQSKPSVHLFPHLAGLHTLLRMD